MTSNFSSFVACVLPDLHGALADDAALERLRAQAGQLPSVYWAGVEVRLDGDNRVDLHQGIRLGGQGGEQLIGRLQQALPSSGGFVSIIQALCLEAKDSVFDYLVLEYDIDGDQCHSAPGVFFAFREEATAQSRAMAAQKLLQPFGLTPTLSSRVSQCFAACQADEQVSHIAVMLGRSLDYVRVNFRNICQERLVPFLRALDFSGPAADASAWFHRYSRMVDRINVCLDIGGTGASNIGLECTLFQAPSEEPRYHWLFTALQRDGLCLPEKLGALLAWPGTLSPMTLAHIWPEELLLESLQRPETQFSVIHKNLAHIKLNVGSDGRARAKAYLGFEHIWRDLALHTQPSVPAEMPAPAADVPAEAHWQQRLQPSMQKAIQYLLGSRHQSGWWQDYPAAPIGLSDEWITAYIGYVLASIDQVETQAAAQAAWALLWECHRPEGGWGWNGHIAADADTTIWALALARALSTPEALLSEALQFVQAHQAPDGGVATYEEHYFKGFHHGGAGVGELLPEWFMPHACVSAAALDIAELRPRALAYLRQQQDGQWPSYWWRDQSFATALAIKGIAHSAEDIGGASDADRQLMARAAAATQAALGDSTLSLTPFVASNHLLILASAGGLDDQHAASTLLQYLLRTQNADGSWPASAVLLPILQRINKHELDLNRNHTTATALFALHAAWCWLNHQPRALSRIPLPSS